MLHETQTMTQVQTQHDTNADYLQFQDYLTGMELYARLLPVDACETQAQRDGWRDAWRADSQFAADEAQSEQLDWRL